MVRVMWTQVVYDTDMDSERADIDPGLGLREAARRLRERLVAAEEAEARARERAEALRIALREVEALISPTAQGREDTGQAARDMEPAASLENRLRPQASPRPPRSRTASDAIRALLTKDPRPWNATEIISVLARSGELDLHDPGLAVRAALRRMTQRGEIRRVGRGFYQAAGSGIPVDAHQPRPLVPLLADSTPTITNTAAMEPKEEEP